MVVAIDGKPRRSVVLAAIEALSQIWHRGAVDADGKTGDGAITLKYPKISSNHKLPALAKNPLMG